MFKVIVCGDREYSRQVMVDTWLDGLYATYGDELYIIEGGAKGADKCARNWCDKKWGVQSFRHHWRCDANWLKYPKWEAGHIRNQQMLDEGEPDLVLAFKDDFNWKMDKGGTENMVKISTEAGVNAFVIQKASV